ncbi:MAG: LTA synthase family protein, partial [Planctomycetota bacterium]
QRFLPSDNISIGSILGITLDIPYRPGTKQLSQLDLSRNKSFPTSSAKLFAAHGYDTAYYYGGPKDWRELDAFLPLQGFDEVVGMEEIIDDYGLDHEADAETWGLWDEHLFRAVADRLRQAQRPTFVVVFSTSNHPPNRLPPGWETRDLVPSEELLTRTGGPLDSTQTAQLGTYQYAAHQLGAWLSTMEEEGILAQSVVGITGDHTAGMGIPFAHKEILLERAVPFLLLLPDAIRQQFTPNTLLPGSHKDMAPTLFHAAGLGQYRYRGFGSSLLDPEAPHMAFNASGLLLLEEGAILLRREGFDTMRWIGDTLDLEPSESYFEAEAAVKRYFGALSLVDWLVYTDRSDYQVTQE